MAVNVHSYTPQNSGSLARIDAVVDFGIFPNTGSPDTSGSVLQAAQVGLSSIVRVDTSVLTPIGYIYVAYGQTGFATNNSGVSAVRFFVVNPKASFQVRLLPVVANMITGFTDTVLTVASAAGGYVGPITIIDPATIPGTRQASYDGGAGTLTFFAGDAITSANVQTSVTPPDMTPPANGTDLTPYAFPITLYGY